MQPYVLMVGACFCDSEARRGEQDRDAQVSGQKAAEDCRSGSAEERRPPGVVVGRRVSAPQRTAGDRAGQVRRQPAVHAESERHRRVQDAMPRRRLRQFPRQMPQAERFVHDQ